jgi:hypothetical protein
LRFGVGGSTGRRRRSWYRRRLRIQRSVIAFVMILLLAGVGWQSVSRFLAYQSRKASRATADPSWKHGDIHAKLASLAAGRERANVPETARRVYPYSVIPGGVRSADDLRRVAEHDRLVWQHYLNFQYQHARLVRATEARGVYLSYRLRNHIYWTRKRIRLHPGELLLTDGTITARTRCGNQISEVPKPDVSAEEPSEDVLNRPVARVEPAPGLPLHSALVRPSLPGVDPLAPKGPQVFGGGFLFPYVPFGVPLSGICENPTQGTSNKNENCVPKRHRVPLVPEPSTIFLISSGLAAVYWQYRRTSQARTH